MNYRQLVDVRAAHAELSDADFLALMVSYDLRPVTESLVTYAVLRERFAREHPPKDAAGRVKSILDAIRAVDSDVADAILGAGIDANLPEITEVLDAFPDQADADIIRDLGRMRKYRWQLAGLNQQPTQDHLDTLPRVQKVEVLRRDAKLQASEAAALHARRQELLDAFIISKDPIPDTIDEVK